MEIYSPYPTFVLQAGFTDIMKVLKGTESVVLTLFVITRVLHMRNVIIFALLNVTIGKQGWIRLTG